MRITINSGTTFLISDKLGNVPEGSELGLYHEDARFLSRFVLTLDGFHLLPLAAHATEPYAAVFFATNPPLRSVPRGLLSVIRRRLLEGDTLQEDIEVVNYGDDAASFTLELALDADFAHLLEVKRALARNRVPAVGKKTIRHLPVKRGYALNLRSAAGSTVRRLVLHLSKQPARSRRGTLRFALRLAAKERWRLTLALHPMIHDVTVRARVNLGPTTSEKIRSVQMREHAELAASAPRLRTDSALVRRAYAQSVRDFAALRITDATLCRDGEYAVAAGIPWFMTLFGRDSLIAAYQTLPFTPDAAKGTLRALARLQGTRLDSAREEEPGKILHEHRHEHYAGRRHPFFRFPYYGTVDATSLFLMLLAATYETTRDLALARELCAPALAALEWMDRYGDRDGDGYLEYQRGHEDGLDNQGWKDSWDAIRFADGTLAEPPIALCEVQGYAYAARVGMADVFNALGEPQRARALRAQAAALKERINRDFWMPEHGYYALALDGRKRQVDAITSNPGHLLWTGAADAEKAAQVVRRLLAEDMFSGWGVRTMATTAGGYNPISYHCGSVWPHDCVLLAEGLARYGHAAEATAIIAGLLRALAHYSDARLPELFAGYGTDEAPIPVEYFASNRPQAWATGSVFALLAVMAHLRPSDWTPLAKDDGAASIPHGIRRLELDGIWYAGERWRVALSRAADGSVHRSATRSRGARAEKARRAPAGGAAGRDGRTRVDDEHVVA